MTAPGPSANAGDTSPAACCRAPSELRVATGAKLLSPVLLFVTLSTVACQAPLSMGILQARILEWVSHTLLQGIFQTQGSNPVSQIVGKFFNI